MQHQLVYSEIVTKALAMEKTFQKAFKTKHFILYKIERRQRLLDTQINYVTMVKIKKLIRKGIERFIEINTIEEDQIRGFTIEDIPVIIIYANPENFSHKFQSVKKLV